MALEHLAQQFLDALAQVELPLLKFLKDPALHRDS